VNRGIDTGILGSMKIELTLHHTEVEEAIKEYVVKRGYVPLAKADLSASQSTDYLDQPTGGHVVSAKIKVESK
jgi:hypothetical protein